MCSVDAVKGQRGPADLIQGTGACLPRCGCNRGNISKRATLAGWQGRQASRVGRWPSRYKCGASIFVKFSAFTNFTVQDRKAFPQLASDLLLFSLLRAHPSRGPPLHHVIPAFLSLFTLSCERRELQQVGRVRPEEAAYCTFARQPRERNVRNWMELLYQSDKNLTTIKRALSKL